MKKKEQTTDIKDPFIHSIDAGHPDYHPGHLPLPEQEVHDEDESDNQQEVIVDEDVQAEKEHEKTQPSQDTDDEERKVVNEQEQDQVVNDDEGKEETAKEAGAAPKQTPKMSDKPNAVVNPQDR